MAGPRTNLQDVLARLPGNTGGQGGSKSGASKRDIGRAGPSGAKVGVTVSSICPDLSPTQSWLAEIAAKFKTSSSCSRSSPSLDLPRHLWRDHRPRRNLYFVSVFLGAANIVQHRAIAMCLSQAVQKVLHAAPPRVVRYPRIPSVQPSSHRNR